MKLGICYMVFDGEELLEFAARSIRDQVDHLAVTYQTTSYFGNPSTPQLVPIIDKLQKEGLIDQAIFYQPDFSLSPKENELQLRNIGLDSSEKADCTHHISSDVDEFVLPKQLNYAKNEMEGCDYSMAPMECYYKKPTYLVSPSQNLSVTFIHPVSNRYVFRDDFPHKIEITRRLAKCDKVRVFSKDELVIHHMSYVRNDIRKKFANSDNGRCYDINKFVANFDNHQIGDRVCLLPDYINRRTKLVDDLFDIQI